MCSHRKLLVFTTSFVFHPRTVDICFILSVTIHNSSLDETTHFDIEMSQQNNDYTRSQVSNKGGNLSKNSPRRNLSGKQVLTIGQLLKSANDVSSPAILLVSRTGTLFAVTRRCRLVHRLKPCIIKSKSKTQKIIPKMAISTINSHIRPGIRDQRILLCISYNIIWS